MVKNKSDKLYKKGYKNMSRNLSKTTVLATVIMLLSSIWAALPANAASIYTGTDMYADTIIYGPGNDLNAAGEANAAVTRTMVTLYPADTEKALHNFWAKIERQIEAGNQNIEEEFHSTKLSAQAIMDYAAKRYFIGYPIRYIDYQIFETSGGYLFVTSATQNNKDAVSTNKAVREWAKNHTAGMVPTLDTAKALFKEMAGIKYSSDKNDYHGAYNFLVGKGMKCDGFSKLYQAELEAIGIECYYAAGEFDGGRHAWNVFVIDGQTYAADCTAAYVSDNYFVRTDDMIPIKGDYSIEYLA